MAAKHRFELTSHLLRMIGVCSDCRKARASKLKTSRAAAR
jgi:Fe2+ or Zn2+ uptake regulation protein